MIMAPIMNQVISVALAKYQCLKRSSMCCFLFIVSILTPGRNHSGVTMYDPYCVSIVFITPRSKWITVCEHHQAFGFNLFFFQIVKDSIKVCAATTFDFIIADAVQVV
jgi:hypothetical protein